MLFSCSNKVAQLTSENKALKTQKKKLMEEAQKLKTNESGTKLKGDSGRRLPEGTFYISLLRDWSKSMGGGVGEPEQRGGGS